MVRIYNRCPILHLLGVADHGVNLLQTVFAADLRAARNIGGKKVRTLEHQSDRKRV